MRFFATFHHIFLLAMKVIVHKGFICIKTIVLNLLYVYIFLFLKDLVTLINGSSQFSNNITVFYCILGKINAALMSLRLL